MYLNDPRRSRVNLTVRGKVDIFAVFSARVVVLQGLAGEKILSALLIKQREEYPFKILKVTARNGRDIKYRLEQLEGVQPTAYKLIVENQKSTPGRYFDTIFLQTDSSIQPKIGINVTGNIKASS